MSGDLVRCALWANDLTRLRQPRHFRGDYALVEVLPALASRLAAAMAVAEREVLDRLGRGCRAFAVEYWREEVASWLWVSTGEEWATPLRRFFRFDDGECYGWNAGTLERHRGRGLCTALLELAGWRMAREGRHTMWNGVLDGNLPSQRAHAGAGFRPVLRLAVLHEPPPTRIVSWPADYADERLVERARGVLGVPTAAEPSPAQNDSEAVVLAASRRR
jgi:hypothetical protein